MLDFDAYDAYPLRCLRSRLLSLQRADGVPLAGHLWRLPAARARDARGGGLLGAAHEPLPLGLPGLELPQVSGRHQPGPAPRRPVRQGSIIH